jgi:hypothetical protein
MDSVIRLAAQYWHLAIVGTLLGLLSLGFIFKFCRQALRLDGELDSSIRELKDIRSVIKGPIVDLDAIADKAMKSPALAHLWSEYAKTLHPQSKEGADGQVRIVKWRSTTLAETFFSEQAVVDTRLKTEFYKHLPGILTGLGIIGTFTGLIVGLNQFNVSLKPELAQEQLSNLVKSVGHAFIISGSAICLAMLFTWIEKSLVASRYRQVEELRGLIDSMFEVGAGEEYLERLVVASENASTQSAHIKDLLVADIKEIMSKLTEQQIAAQAQQTNQISVDVGKAISDSLGPPMQAISEAVKGVGQNQGEAVNKMLTDVLSSFSAQMRDMFGGQMQGMSDLLRKTSESMQTTAMQFGQLAVNMDAAGTGAVQAMGDRLNSALEAMEARQQIMNTHMSSFVESIRNMVSESQSESARKLQETLGAVGDQVAGVIAELRRQAEASAESQGARQERFEKSTGASIGSLSEHMEKLLGQSVETNKVLQDTVAKLASATDKAITGMNSGAETLHVAASDFAKAGQGVADTMRASTIAVEAIKAASGQLTMATEGARGVLEDYGRTRDTFAVMVSELKLTIDTAKREASMTTEFVSRIEAATAQLSLAQKQSEDYLKNVSDVLTKAHESFAQNVERSLREGNRQFQGELAAAVQLLSGAIKNLGDLVDDLPTKR